MAGWMWVSDCGMDLIAALAHKLTKRFQARDCDTLW